MGAAALHAARAEAAAGLGEPRWGVAGPPAAAEEIVADFPTLTPAAVRAVIAFAAASAEEDLPVLGAPIPA